MNVDFAKDASKVANTFLCFTKHGVKIASLRRAWRACLPRARPQLFVECFNSSFLAHPRHVHLEQVGIVADPGLLWHCHCCLECHLSPFPEDVLVLLIALGMGAGNIVHEDLGHRMTTHAL